MRGYNKAIIMGNLARDPEVRYTQTNKAVASFSVAVNRSWRDQNGETKEDVTFIPVVVWGKAAETCQRYLKKGSGVLIEGRISVRSYDKDGEKKYITEIVADNVQFVGGKTDGQAGGQSNEQNRPQTQQQDRQSMSTRDLAKELADATGGEVIMTGAPAPESETEEADIPF